MKKNSDDTGWDTKVGPLRLTPTFFTSIFITPQPDSMIFRTIQRHFILNTFIDSKFIKFIKVAAPGESLMTLILLSTNAKGSLALDV